jgi:hypothetical protein
MKLVTVAAWALLPSQCLALTCQSHLGSPPVGARARLPPTCSFVALDDETTRWQTRRRVLTKAASLLALPAALLGRTPTASAVEEAPGGAAPSAELERVTADDGSFSFTFPSGAFEKYSKPLKTHLVEVNVKSVARKGYVVGVAVDPVKLESLEGFGNPDFVGGRVLAVERKKDGVLDARLDSTRATTDRAGMTYYELECVPALTRRSARPRLCFSWAVLRTPAE